MSKVLRQTFPKLPWMFACAVLVSSASFAAEISDRTCEIGIPEATGGLADYRIKDSTLQELVNKGYGPYRSNSVSSGLFLRWGFSCSDHWYGESCDVHATLVRRGGGREIVLGTGNGSTIDSAVSDLPNCRR